MSALAATFPIYLWHYLLARLIYDDLVRPITHGRASVLVGAMTAFGLAVLWWRAGHSRRRR